VNNNNKIVFNISPNFSEKCLTYINNESFRNIKLIIQTIFEDQFIKYKLKQEKEYFNQEKIISAPARMEFIFIKIICSKHCSLHSNKSCSSRITRMD
jgi:hypothetical protein